MYLFNYLSLSTSYTSVTLDIIYLGICLCTCLRNYVSAIYLHISVCLCIYVSIAVSFPCLCILHPSTQRELELRTFWGEGWLGPSVKLPGLGAAAGREGCPYRTRLTAILEAGISRGPEPLDQDVSHARVRILGETAEHGKQFL